MSFFQLRFYCLLCCSGERFWSRGYGRFQGYSQGFLGVVISGLSNLQRGWGVSSCRVLADVSMELSDGAAISTIRGADNVVYFTREQFTTELRLPISSLVKQFLHLTRAPPALIHLNVFRILMGCSVLNFLYQVDISLVEVCFIYTLKLGIRVRLFISAYNPRLNFVTRLLDSPKTEAKWVVLVKGLWYETLGSLRLPFDLNQSLTFLGLCHLDGACSYLDFPCVIPLFFGL